LDPLAPPDPEGMLAFADGQLVAVLTRLGSGYAEETGRWFLEAGFDALDVHNQPTFADLDGAQEWLIAGLARRAVATPALPEQTLG
jgi:hypothetical protein